MTNWVDQLNRCVLSRYNTRLVGGYDEPYYQAATAEIQAEVQFTRDYERSALHELGHWCIAGDARRSLDDYGYWYVPDGRADEQQRLFYEVEARPQAVEKHFCLALGITFEVSADNLATYPQDGIDAFTARVDEQYQTYIVNGLRGRATEIFNCLHRWRKTFTDKNAA